MTLSKRAALLALTTAVALCSYAKPAPRHLHVAVVGDSLAFGSGDEAGKGIAGRIEPELRSRGSETVLTTNLAAAGATTADVMTRLREPATRAALAAADAIVLSSGANDFRPRQGERLRSPLLIVEDVLRNLDSIVAELHGINPKARVLILGAYTPVAHERTAELLEPLILMWDALLVMRFADNPLVSFVRLSDIVNRPERLSTIDGFHPGGEAYQEAARRIAELLSDAS